MKRKLFFLALFACLSIIAIGQVTDTTATVTYSFGDSLKDFLTKNMWTLIFTGFFLLSEWLGQTGKIKEGSVFALVINWIGKFLRSKAVVKSKKAAFMDEVEYKMARGLKIAIIAVLLSGIGISASAQSKWDGFFKPVTMEKVAGIKSAGQSQWLFRPAIELSALQFTYDKTEKEWLSSSIQSAGVGIGYQHYITVNDKAYNDFGFNALLLFDLVPAETSATAISGALTVSALSFVNVGAGYTFGLNKFFLLSGITYNF